MSFATKGLTCLLPHRAAPASDTALPRRPPTLPCLRSGGRPSPFLHAGRRPLPACLRPSVDDGALRLRVFDGRPCPRVLESQQRRGIDSDLQAVTRHER
jgi:hypothetical protein